MEASPHVFLAGQGALAFAIDQGLELKPSEWFWTERRWQQMQRATLQGARPPAPSEGRFGTVGAVALDASGHLAAARTICARMALAGESPEQASAATLAEIRKLGGLGGVIVLDGAGWASFAFSTEGMYRGRADGSGRQVAIFAAEERP